MAQSERWLSAIARPTQLQASWLPGTNAATVRFRPPNVRADWMRPSNVGFGLSYALPVVVGGLVASIDRILIVENPEAHLHPAGQSEIGRFLATIAASGVQTIVETHSDHVLNGIRHAIALGGALEPEDAVFHFLSSEDTVAIDVDARGALSSWPAGFFDQGERDLTDLARIKRSV